MVYDLSGQPCPRWRWLVHWLDCLIMRITMRPLHLRQVVLYPQSRPWTVCIRIACDPESTVRPGPWTEDLNPGPLCILFNLTGLRASVFSACSFGGAPTPWVSSPALTPITSRESRNWLPRCFPERLDGCCHWKLFPGPSTSPEPGQVCWAAGRVT